MNTLKKATLAVTLLIPANSTFAGFSDWCTSAKDTVKNAATSTSHFISNKTSTAWLWSCSKIENNSKILGDKIKEHPIHAAFVGAGTGAGLYLLGKNRTAIKNFSKNQVQNIRNKYSNLKEKYNNADKNKKSKIKKGAIATTTLIGTGISAYYLYKKFFGGVPGPTAPLSTSNDTDTSDSDSNNGGEVE